MFNTRYTAVYRKLSADEKRKLARRVGSSVQTLAHYAAGWREGRPYKMSAERAIEVTDALQKMGYKKVRRSWCRPDLWGRDSEARSAREVERAEFARGDE